MIQSRDRDQEPPALKDSAGSESWAVGAYLESVSCHLFDPSVNLTTLLFKENLNHLTADSKYTKFVVLVCKTSENQAEPKTKTFQVLPGSAPGSAPGYRTLKGKGHSDRWKI